MSNKIKLYTAEDEHKEAAFIINEVEQLVGGFHNLTVGNKHTDSHYGFSDIAVLFRTRAVGSVLLSSFKKSGIPVRFGDAASFLADYPFHLVTDVIKWYLDAGDLIALDSVLTNGFKMSKNEKQVFLASHAEKKRFAALFGGQDLTKLGAENTVKFIFQKFIPDETLDDMGLIRKETLFNMAKEYGAALEQFLQQLLLDAYTDAGRLKTDAVHLLTFHASKGLEFPVVFIAGAEEGITPLQRKDVNIEEERRLFYVALTRAKDRLFITNARQRKGFREEEAKSLSGFVKEIPASLTETIQNKQSKPEQMRLF
ncbi:3'-5' exonuclease [Niabella ginsenosidivorans]|nr:ATP-dependent helicase [Niabella ginsenosidivorans]